MKICSIRAILSLIVIALQSLPIRAEVAITDAEGRRVLIKDTSRIVSVGGSVAEIVCALGAEARLVGVDTSSVFPVSLKNLPQVGYQRTLSAEGVLSLRPTLILASQDAGPPAIVAQLKQTGVPYVVVPSEHSVGGVKNKIRLIANALAERTRGEELVGKIDASLSSILPVNQKHIPKVLFIYARGAGTLNIAGKDTAADAMIKIAGGLNAVSGYSSYKPMTAESLVAAAPDVILLTTLGLESLGGVEGLLKQPGILQTPAGKKRKIIAMDDLLLLGFGPRLGSAVRELSRMIYEDSPKHASQP